MKIVGVLVACALATGCNKKPDKAAHDRDCEEMGKAFEALRRAEPPPANEAPDAKEKREKFHADNAKLSVLHCINDNWSAEATACVKTAASPNDCLKHMTTAQQDKLKPFKNKEVEVTRDGSGVQVEVKDKAEPPKPE